MGRGSSSQMFEARFFSRKKNSPCYTIWFNFICFNYRSLKRCTGFYCFLYLEPSQSQVIFYCPIRSTTPCHHVIKGNIQHTCVGRFHAPRPVM
jgi:hypothetical protein